MINLVESDFINQIIENYKIGIKHQKILNYTKGAHWNNAHNKIDSKKIIDHEVIKNFRFNKTLSYGLDDSEKSKGLIYLLGKSKEWNIDNKFLQNNLPKENIGNNNNSTKFLDYFFDNNELQHIKWANDLIKKIDCNKIKSICEIGGGYGSFARIILNNINAKYFLIDFPEANLISSFYLKSHFPKKKFFMYSEKNKNITDKDLLENDIFIFPPWIINDLNNIIKIDLFINTHSFMEMPKKNIEEYFNFIHKRVSENGYFLNVNRYRKETSGESIRFSKYPYDSYWDCIISHRCHTRFNVHFLLTQRKRENIEKKINEELKKIVPCETNSYNSKEYLVFSNIPLIRKLEFYFRKFSKLILIKLFGVKLLNRIGLKLYLIKNNN